MVFMVVNGTPLYFNCILIVDEKLNVKFIHKISLQKNMRPVFRLKMAIFESFSPFMLMISKSNHEKSWLGMLEGSVKHNPSIFWPDQPPKKYETNFFHGLIWKSLT